ncbi:major capsid protein [Rhodanobacter sp. FW102-FHT14D06]|uniref:Major capsid protein n=2 Tax=unclassified Rhodanobacter TaxID=2621553 RepID=A0AB74UVB8_9GAMM
MATLGTNSYTLLDVAKRIDPDGKAAQVAEMLSQDNEILDDMPWLEGNLPTGHRVTVRTGLPDAAWRKLNQGVPRSKSTVAQIDEACAMLEAWSDVDKDLAELNGLESDFRLTESSAFIESINQKMASTIFYGNSVTAPESFLGMAPRFDDVPTTSGGAENKDNVIDAGGTGTDNTSIWLIGWGPKTVHGIYPKASRAGLFHEDLGLDTVLDSNGNPYRAYRDHYQWKCGLALRDWRYVVRIANIDVSDLTADAATGAKLINLMTQALERIHSLNGVRPAFYMNRTIRSILRQQQVNAVKNSTLSVEELFGKRVLMASEVPCRRTDALLNSEARVV